MGYFVICERLEQEEFANSGGVLML